jgi:hypothetical protein
LCEKDRDMQMRFFTEVVRKMMYWWPGAEMRNYASKYTRIDLSDIKGNLDVIHASRCKMVIEKNKSIALYIS